MFSAPRARFFFITRPCNKHAPLHAITCEFFFSALKRAGALFTSHKNSKPAASRMQARTEPARVVTELSPEVTDAFKDARLLALDVEGVDLSREGAFLPISVHALAC